MNYIGDFEEDSVIVLQHFTQQADGTPVAPSSPFVAADFRIYKDGGAAEKTAADGITVTSPFDSITGKHLIVIDTSDDTNDAGFWTAGSDYRVEINSATTVDSKSQSGVVVATFSIENRYSPMLDDATIDAIATAVATSVANIRLSVQSQIALSGGDDISIVQGDDYTRAGIRIDLDTSGMDDPMIDLSAYKFIIAANTQLSSDKIIVRMPIEGAAGSHFVVFDPPSSLTEAWPTGTFNLLYRLEWAANEYETLQATGVLTVAPFDVDEADIVDLV